LIKVENVIDDEPATERLFTEEWKSTHAKFYSAWDESTKPIEGTAHSDWSTDMVYNLKEKAWKLS